MTPNDSIEALLDRGDNLLDRGQYQDGLDTFQQAALLEPENPKVLYALGVACYWLKRYQESIEYLTQALTKKPLYPLALARRGMAYQELKQNQQATADFERAISIEAQDHEDWRGRGLALYELKRYEEAIASFDKAIELQPDDHNAWNNRGNTLDELKRYEEAIASYDKAIELQPDYHYAWFNRGNALYELKRYEEAIASFDKAIELHPDFHIAWYSYGSTFAELKRYEEAIASFDKAIELHPDFHIAWNNRGLALKELKRYKDAIASYDKAIELHPDNKDAWNGRGLLLCDNLRRYEEAIASFKKAIELQPDDHIAWNNRGAVLCDNLGRYEEAIADFTKAIDIKPDFWQAWYNRGWAIFKSRGLRDAIDNWYNGLQRIKPTEREGRGELHYRIGLTYYEHGKSARGDFNDFIQAKDSYERARECFNTEPLLQRNLDVLESLIQVSKELPNSEEAIKKLRSEGTLLLEQLFKQPHITNAQKISLSRKFSSFDQYVVDELVHSGKTIEALEFAEQRKNKCLGWLQRGWSYQTDSPKYPQIKQLLKPHTAAIYWHLSPVSLTTFILRHNDKEPQPLHQERSLVDMFFKTRRTSSRPAVQQREFEQWMQEWKRDYQNYRATEDANREKYSWRQKMRAQLEKLRVVLDIDEILKHLKGVEQLILIPHRDLHLLPLEFLFSEKFAITRLPSAQIGLQIANFKSLVTDELPLLNVEQLGNPQLIFAFIEAAAISLLYPNQNRLGTTATTAQVFQALRQGSGILNFIGHAYHNIDQPLESALVFDSGDILTMNDIFQVEELHKYRLICLSACETGITGNQNLDEYVGLASAFLAMKAICVLSTLWTVEEKATALFLIEFYKLRDRGTAPSLALKQTKHWLSTVTHSQLAQWYRDLAGQFAQRGDRTIEFFLTVEADKQQKLATIYPSDRPYQHPYYWAAFTITGAV